MLIKGEKSQIKQALESIEGVNSVTIEKDEKQNLWSTKVSTEENNDIREKVFYKMSDINSPIYEMKSKKYLLRKYSLNLQHLRNRHLQVKMIQTRRVLKARKQQKLKRKL